MKQNLPDFQPLREKPSPHQFKPGDTLVIFGELFNRGYANGLVEEAERNGLTIIRATVGRRDENHELRPLNAEEQAQIPQPFINIPLEAGFDLEKDETGQTPNDYLKGVKLSEWQQIQVPSTVFEKAKASARTRFRKNTEALIHEVEKLVAPGSHIHFAHLMAGGIPRTKIVMPLINRVFKGVGERYLDSATFMKSAIGEYLRQNFLEVTAETFNILIEASTDLRARQESSGGSVSYVAYGYHGTEVLVGNEYRWQSYAPYIQGWAKILLEDYSKKWSALGVRSCVYNCPEILTNSSSIFQGVEVPLYNLLRALEKEIPSSLVTQKLREECRSLLKDPENLKSIYQQLDDHMIMVEKAGTSQYIDWPQHSTPEVLAAAINLSNTLTSIHKDEKHLMAPKLSEIIFKACGYIMLHDGYKPKYPAAWIGHDIVARCASV